MRSPMLATVLRIVLVIGVLDVTGTAQIDDSSSPTSRPNAPATSTASGQQDIGSSTAQASTASEARQEIAKDAEIPVESSKIHWHLGTISVGAAYSSGPYYPPYGFYPYGPYGWYPGGWVGSAFWYPLWGGYPFYPAGSFAYNGGRGELRLAADPRQAEVYIDGAYAGTADQLKTMWLDPGAYDLTVSAKDREAFHQRVYVLSGKSLKITAKLGSGEAKQKL